MKLGDFFDLKDVIGGNTMNIIDELEWRGAINQTTDKEALKELTENKNIGLYCGGIALSIARVRKNHVSFADTGFSFWRRRRDLNPRDGFPPYSLSRGAPSATWVLLRAE